MNNAGDLAKCKASALASSLQLFQGRMRTTKMMNHWAGCYENGEDAMVIMDFKSGDISKFMTILIQEVCEELKKDINGAKCQDFGWSHLDSRIFL